MDLSSPVAPSFPHQQKCWTAERKRAFLDQLARTPNVRVAAAAAGMSRQAAYRLRKRDAAFAGEWDALIERAYNRLFERAFFSPGTLSHASHV